MKQLETKRMQIEETVWTINESQEKTYLRKHKATMHSRYGNKEAEAEGYIECMQVTPAGAVFYQSGNLLKLTDEEIKKEVWEHDG